MTKVTLDQETVEKLHNLTTNLEVCDEAGNRLGYFVPSEDKAMYAEVESQVSEAELDRRDAEESGRPLADILRDLEKMS